ncbi:MAG: hypothetical protein O3A51_12880 [Verrucomicrobia bacterium]|nr:hypothetical protein [Verrucomicrobiota bacterium]
MSLVHKILRRDNPNDDDGAESTATPPSETVPGRINIQQVLEQTREKEQRLKQGIERLRQQKAALQERLEAAERGLAQRDNDLERLRESAQRREEELLASIQELKDLLVDATTDLKH